MTDFATNRIGKVQSTNFPLVSFIVLTYNQERFVEEAVRAALQQTYEPLEIIISDDASTDITYEKVLAVIDNYRGPHRVVVNKNEKNMGINAHVNFVVNMAQGEFVVASAGDDLSLPERTEKLVRKWRSGVSGVFSNATLIDENGDSKGFFVNPGYRHMKDWHEMIVAGIYGAWGCTFAWDKAVFNVFGDIHKNIMGEDAIIPFRCALLNGVSYVDEPLVRYRDHGENVSFWAQEKLADAAGILQLGHRTFEYKLQMYENWALDLNTAYEQNVIKAQPHRWGLDMLKEKALLVRTMNSLLSVNLLVLVVYVPAVAVYYSGRMCRLISPITAVKETVWTLLNGILHFRSPRLHLWVRRLLGRNT